MPRIQPWMERRAFRVGVLVAAPVTPLCLLLAAMDESHLDGAAVFTVLMGVLVVGMLLLALVEFETDGLMSWILGGGVQVPHLGLGYFVGAVLKTLAIVHGVAALIFGSLLAMEGSEVSRIFSSGLFGLLIALRAFFVIWLWAMTIASYLAGDGWMRRAQRVDELEEQEPADRT